MTKLRQGATIYLDAADMAAILGNDICSFIGPFSDLEIWRIERVGGRGVNRNKFRLDLAPKAKAKPPVKLAPVKVEGAGP